MRRTIATAGVLLAIGLAACGGDSGTAATTTSAVQSTTTTAPATTTTAPATTTTAPAATTVAVASSSLGDIVVDSEGRTLYLFMADQGTTSACNAGCVDLWPPLTVEGAPTGGDGIDAALLGTAVRADGSTQVTYNGHLLYHYANDAAPGDTNGNGIGNLWFAVTPAGEAVAA